jgi:hypothetical protein
METATRTELEAQLRALREARASGARRVVIEVEGVRREVEYRSDSELRAALADLEHRLATPRRVVTISPSKGLRP